MATKLALHKRFSVDEFQYVHGAWLTARGEVIYRDFFEHHFPLVHQIMAIPWLFLEDDPTNIIALRAAFLPVFFLLICSAWWINRSAERVTGLITPLVILATSALVGMGVEIRPDTLAFALFLAGVALLYARPRDSPLTSFVSGLLITLSLWGTQKVVYYGLPIAAVFVLDWLRLRTGSEKRQLVGNIRAFTAGSAMTIVAIATYLTATKSWSAWYEWGVRWSFVHQLHYPPFPWTQNLLPLISLHTWLFVLATVGVVHTCRRVFAKQEREVVHPDLILLGLLVTTLASAAWQVAPYLYSFLPFLTVLAIFAARGITATYQTLVGWRSSQPVAATFFMALGVLLLAGELLHVRTILNRELQLDNAKQVDQLQLVGELTSPDDAVFDIAGERVARPGIHYFYFTDAVIRELEAATLAQEFPAGIVQRECAVYLHDDRFSSFPGELKHFLVNNFQPMTANVWLWGRRFHPNLDPNSASAFLAVKAGKYFVQPPQAFAQGKILIDDQPLSAPEVSLEKGVHRVRSSPGTPAFSLLWLPRNGQHWAPQPHPAAVLSSL
jgi:hypothetical protein